MRSTPALVRAACLAFVVLGVIGFFPIAARGQAGAPPQLNATVDPQVVAVGQPFTVELTVLADGSGPQPSGPSLSLPSGLAASGPSIGSQTQINFVNGRISRQVGITATWQVIASRAGTFTIPGPTVTYGGQRLQTNALRVVVQPGPPAGGAGQGPAAGRRRGMPFDPFDPFGMLPGFPGFFNEPPSSLPSPNLPTDPQLGLDQAPDQAVFLRALADKKSAVVGEQVTLTVYVYWRGGSLESSETHEPALTDFLRRELPAPANPDTKLALVGGAVWHAEAIFRAALFPLKAGNLTIAPARAPSESALGRAGIERASSPLVLHVGEPPLAGRPPGYPLGSVGEFSIAASVEPRKSEVGGAVAVTVTVTGTGNPPSSLAVPAKTGIEWLDPQVRESIDPDASGKIKGSKTFAYVVRPTRAGTLDLGAILLPYWDPVRRTYVTARAELGSITVAPAAPGSKDLPPVTADPLADVGPVRTRLGPAKAPVAPLTERRAYWLLLFGAPLLVAATSLAFQGARALAHRIAERNNRPSLAIEQALAEARRAERGGDPRAVAACLERALHAAIEATTALRARALLLEEIAPALMARGLEPTLAGGTRDLLGQLESLRFSPAEQAALAGLVPRTESLVKSLRRANLRKGA